MKSLLLTILAGSLMAFALPPYGYFICFIIGLFIFWYIIQKKLIEDNLSLKKSILLFWGLGFGYFASSLYWIANALMVDSASFGWLIPFAILGLPAALAIFWAFAGISFYFARQKTLLLQLLIFGASITSVEWLRGHIFTGFPWNLPSHILAADDNMMQILAYIGSYWGIFLVLFLGSIPFFVYKLKSSTYKFINFMLFLGSISSIYAFGYHRIQSYEPQYYENVFVRLVQPNIAQKMRWSHEQREENFNKVLKASQLNKKDLSKITHFIWSETAVPFLLYADKEKFSQINKQLLQNTKTLITGQIRFDEQGYLRNSVMAFTSEGQVIDYYDKTHLVPFGEYLPYDDVLSKIGFRKIVPFGKGFAEGEKRKSIQMGHFPTFLPLICYEIIFSNVTEKQKNIDFDVIVNVTNDAWFGNSIGPYQHLTHAKLRALENGVTVLRVANTGISAVINPLGIIKKSTKIDKTAIIDTKIEKKYQN